MEKVGQEAEILLKEVQTRQENTNNSDMLVCFALGLLGVPDFTSLLHQEVRYLFPVHGDHIQVQTRVINLLLQNLV